VPTPFWCLLVVVVIPFVLAGIGGYYRTKQFGAPDNRNPRQQALALEGAGARAVAAQQNAWEALAVFAPAVIVAHLEEVAAGTATTVCLIFVAARIAHAIFYITDKATPRTLVFVVGLVSVLTLFGLAARA
jgi:uncharacterized MAPEG superfamily protein